MEAQEAARDAAFARALYTGDAAALLKGTTHISVLDADGNAASLSSSLGSGSGVVVPGTGIHLNNMLGELDLVGASKPGERLTSMMSPSIVLDDGRPRLVLGSAGSARLRGAILQVTANVVATGMSVEQAVEAPRIHAEAGVVHCEAAPAADALEVGGPNGRPLEGAEPVLRRRERGRGASRRRRRQLRAIPRRGGAGASSREHRVRRARGRSGGRRAVDAARGGGERRAGGVADLGRTASGAASATSGAISRRCGATRTRRSSSRSERRRDHRAAVARARHASGERARRRSRADGREGCASRRASGGRCSKRRSTGRAPAASGSSSCTSFRGTSRRSALYERFGFEREGLRKRHYRRAGEDVDAILMAFSIDAA